jgi:hypothetical protein
VERARQGDTAHGVDELLETAVVDLNEVVDRHTELGAECVDEELGIAASEDGIETLASAGNIDPEVPGKRARRHVPRLHRAAAP